MRKFYKSNFANFCTAQAKQKSAKNGFFSRIYGVFSRTGRMLGRVQNKEELCYNKQAYINLRVNYKIQNII